MFEKELPARPNIEQYKNQAKDLVRDCSLSVPAALQRIAKNHPRFHKFSAIEWSTAKVALTDAQLVLAREHGFESWPKFAKHIETDNLIRSVAALTDPVSAFIEAACSPRHAGHNTGTLEHAELILARYPEVASTNIHTAAILGDENSVRRFLAANPQNATATGGPNGWDPLTHLCFSRYLRIDKRRSEAFVQTAKALLDAGADAKTGWQEMIDHPNPRPVLESAIYGAAGIAQNPELTRLLLNRGADPNDEETPYHVPESYDNAVLNVLLESGKLTRNSLTTMMIRKADWHDIDGLQLILKHGGDPNDISRFGNSVLHHALLRDNRISAIELLLNHHANPAIHNTRDGRTAFAIAAHRGRADVLRLFEQRNIPLELDGANLLIAACASGSREEIQSLISNDPQLATPVLTWGGTLLAEFAGNNNAEGIRCLLDLGIDVAALYKQGDGYFEIAKDSTALHVAAWRAADAAVTELIARGAPVNVADARARTPLMLAVKACVDSHWKDRRTPESIEALLKAGASPSGIAIPTGYDEADTLLRQYSG